jgi:hypothetical protein
MSTDGREMREMKKAYSIGLALNSSYNAARVDLVLSLQKIFKTFNVLGSEKRTENKEALKKLLSIESVTKDTIISDENWLNALDLVFMYKSFFELRRAWINNNLGPEFFNVYQVYESE